MRLPALTSKRTISIQVRTITTGKKTPLRKMIFAVAGSAPIDFDTLCDRVMAALDEYRLWAQRVRIPDEPVVVLLSGASEAA